MVYESINLKIFLDIDYIYIERKSLYNINSN